MLPSPKNSDCRFSLCTRRSSSTPDRFNKTGRNGVNDINSEVMRDMMFIKQESSFEHTQLLRVLYEESHPMLLSYTCQLAHGSAPIKVSNFSSVGELYAQMAYAFGISCDDIIFCTINTHEVDMDRVFIGCLEPEDILYAHVRGQQFEVEITKKEETLGITIADNGLCRGFIKHIKENIIPEAARDIIVVGQQIISIQGQSVLGLRHYEIAKVINKIPIGQRFSMGLINPLTSVFSFHAQCKNVGGGITMQLDRNKKVIDRMSDLFDAYLGVQDDELAETIWSMVKTTATLGEMMQMIKDSELNDFDFPDKLLFDMWGIVSDYARMAM